MEGIPFVRIDIYLITSPESEALGVKKSLIGTLSFNCTDESLNLPTRQPQGVAISEIINFSEPVFFTYTVVSKLDPRIVENRIFDGLTK